MSQKKEKKGVSTVITAVLLISITLVLVGIIFVFGKNLLQRAQEEASGEKLCNEASFSVGDFCRGIQSVQNTETGITEQKPYIKFNGRNNIADSKLEGFLISLDYGGTMVPISTLPYSEIEGGKTKTLFTDTFENPDIIEQIKVIPKINNDEEVIVCDKNNQIFRWDEVEQC